MFTLGRWAWPRRSRGSYYVYGIIE